MDTKRKVASDKPFLTDTELFDILITISLVTKALAKKILLLPTEEKSSGGKRDVSKETLNSGTK